MFKYVLFFLALLWETSRAQVTPPPSMDSIVRKNAGTSNPWAGLSIGVIRDGQVYQYNFGTTGKSNGNVPAAPDAHTLYEIGSMSKTFASLLLAQAVVEKRVQLTDDIRRYLKGDYPNLQFRGKPIELLHLINLTSGLPNNLPDFEAEAKKAPADSFAYVVIKANEHYTREDFFRDLRQVKLDTFPGSIPRHSNTAGVLLGYILENIYGEPYATLLKKYITDPLQLNHTYLAVPASEHGLLAKCYNQKGVPMPYIIPNAWAAGGMSSCLEDMIRYLTFQLSEQSEALRLTHQTAWGNPQEFAIGMNWFLHTTFDGKRKVTHDGTTFGFTTCFELYPDQHFGVVILTNQCGDGVTDGLYGMADRIFNENFYTVAERESDGFGFSSSINALLTGVRERGFDHAVEVTGELAKNRTGFVLDDNEVNNWADSCAACHSMRRLTTGF